MPEPSAKDIEFSLNIDMQRTGDLSVNLTMKNTSDESRLADVHLSALSCKYTGISNADIKDTSTATVLEPNARKCCTIDLHIVEASKFCKHFLIEVNLEFHRLL